MPPAVPRSGVSAEARRALKQMLEDDSRLLATSFAAGAGAEALARRRSRTVARIVTHVWIVMVGDSKDAALFAVGGFGRGMLFPHSDVDLLVLARATAARAHERALQGFFTCLWDIGLTPGQAVRDPEQCRELAAEDVSVFTSLLDARRLAGDAAMDGMLAGIVDAPDMWPPQTYLDAKLADQRERH